MTLFAGCRSILFVPADRPDRCAKAIASGADAVCIDLEDAVAPARKEAGREALRSLLAGRAGGIGAPGVPSTPGTPSAPSKPSTPRKPLLVVRVNDPTSVEGRLDAETLAKVGAETQARSIKAAMIPKLRSGRGLQRAAAMLPEGLALLPMIETADGLENGAEIGDGRKVPCDDAMDRASALPVAGLVFGGFDLALEFGAEPDWESLLYARSRVVHAASLAGVPAFDMPSLDIHGELAGLRDEAERARRLGFSGKTVVHPAQLPAVHRAFTPSADAVAAARRVVEADRDAAGGPVALDGRMVDRPIVEAARRTLARASAETLAKAPAQPPAERA